MSSVCGGGWRLRVGPGVSLPSLWPRQPTGACPTAVEVTSYLVGGWGKRFPQGAKTISLSQNSGMRWSYVSPFSKDMVDTEQEGWRGCSGSEGQPGTTRLSCQAQTLWVQSSCSVLRGLPWIREKRSHVRPLGACVPELCGLVCYRSRGGREVSFHRGRRKACVIGRTEDRVIAGWVQS